MSSTPKEATSPTATTAAAISSTMMADNFIGYYKTMVFQAEPFAAFGATAVTEKIYDKWDKEYSERNKNKQANDTHRVKVSSYI